MHSESFQRISSIIQEMPEFVQDSFSILVNDGTFGGEEDLTFLSSCAICGCLEPIKMILDTIDDVNVINKCINVALDGAIFSNQLEIVRFLLKERVVDIEERTLISCLALFAKEGCLESIKMILDTGTDISRNAHSSLHLAAKNGHLDNGVDINALSGRHGYTALHLAAENGHSEIVKTLLDNGVDINALAGRHGYTALHLAAENGHSEIVKILLDNGVDINALAGGSDYTALRLAAKNGHSEVVKFLLDNGGNINRNSSIDLHEAICNGHSKVVETLLNNGADMNAIDNTVDGYTALHLAAYYGRSEIVKILLDNGDNIERKDAKGFTALHIAASQDKLETAKLLMKYLLIANPNVSVPDLDGINRQDWNNYRAELEKMKERDNDLYDFLVAKNLDEKVRILTGSKKVQQVIQQNRLTIEYPNYAEDLTSKIESMVFFLNNKEMINSLSKHYNEEIKTIRKTEILFYRFQRENLGYETKFFSPQLNYNTKELQMHKGLTVVQDYL